MLAFLILSCAALALLGGCNSNAPAVGSVQGQITYQSQPVTEGNVVFENFAQGWLRASPLDGQGQFQIDDVKVAEYTVSVVPPDPKLPNETSGIDGRLFISQNMLPDPKNIPHRFRSSETTPFKAHVIAGPNRFDRDLASPSGE